MCLAATFLSFLKPFFMLNTKQLIAVSLLSLAACTKTQDSKQAGNLTASNQSKAVIIKIYQPTDRCVLIAQDANFLAYRKQMEKVDVAISNPYLDLHELASPGLLLAPAQADALAKKLGFLNVTDINAWWKQAALSYMAVNAKFGKIDNQTMTDACILTTADVGLIPAACVGNYANCRIETSIKYNGLVGGCFLSSVFLTATLTPVGGVAYMLGCGGLAIYARHGWLVECANNYKTCMLPKITLLPPPITRNGIELRLDLISTVTPTKVP